MSQESSLTPLHHWSAYWESGAKHSLPQDFIGNYDREIAAFWHDQFLRLPQRGAVLDICTGAGAIALLAARWAHHQNRSISITAIDGAAVNLDDLFERWGRLGRFISSINFMFSSPLERIDVAHFANSFDLIVSQYGVEYCNLEDVAPMLSAALRPGGCFAMITHSPDSSIMKTMRNELADYETLVDTGYFDLLLSWANQQITQRDLMAHLGSVSRTLQLLSTRSPLIASVIKTNKAIANQTADVILAQHSQARAYLEQLQTAQSRLSDVLKVSQKVAKGHSWLHPLLDSGLVLTAQDHILVDKQHVAGMGWILEKPA